MRNLLIKLLLWAHRFALFAIVVLVVGGGDKRTRYLDGRDLLALLQQPANVAGPEKLSNFTRHHFPVYMGEMDEMAE